LFIGNLRKWIGTARQPDSPEQNPSFYRQGNNIHKLSGNNGPPL
jgi:hypothetical protein